MVAVEVAVAAQREEVKREAEMAVEIEHDVPIPAKASKYHEYRAVLEALNVGDSILLPVEAVGPRAKASKNFNPGSLLRFDRFRGERQFLTRLIRSNNGQIGGKKVGWRIWRVK
jgi:hypothetical protein